MEVSFFILNDIMFKIGDHIDVYSRHIGTRILKNRIIKTIFLCEDNQPCRCQNRIIVYISPYCLPLCMNSFIIEKISSCPMINKITEI